MENSLQFKHTDDDGRRLRYVPQKDMSRSFEVTERESRLLLFLKRHKGPLPTWLLYPEWKRDSKGSKSDFQKRLTPLFHGTRNTDPLLIRPRALNPEYGAKCQQAWYDLSEEGHLLAHTLEPRPFRAAKRDNYHHRAMGSCISASFDYEALRHGIAYIGTEQILAHESCPNHTRASSSPLLIPLHGGHLEPDDLFGIEYPDGFSFFFREDDRATESHTRADKTQNSIKRKIERYDQMFAEQAHKDTFGIPNARVIFFTTSQLRVEKLKEDVASSPYAHKYLFKALPMFSSYGWRAPKEPLAEVFTPYHSIAGPVDISKPPPRKR